VVVVVVVLLGLGNPWGRRCCCWLWVVGVGRRLLLLRNGGRPWTPRCEMCGGVWVVTPWGVRQLIFGMAAAAAAAASAGVTPAFPKGWGVV
jgi:hypothetical protein